MAYKEDSSSYIKPSSIIIVCVTTKNTKIRLLDMQET